MSKEREILEALVVDNEDMERLEVLLAQFNIFEVVGAVRQELRHSDFLAFLLDPNQNHGLGDVFLKRLLKRVLVSAADPPLSAVEIDVADLHEAEIRREWRHIDILILDPANRIVCAIENKVVSGEHGEQLRRYQEIVAGEFPNYRAILIYLTLEGNEPSEETYIPFSYTQVAELLDIVCQAHESTLGPDVHTLMTHYTAMLRRYIVSESEIADLCRRIYRRHKQALDLVFEHRPDLQANLADVLKGLVEESSSHDLVLDHCSKSYIRFALEELDAIPAQLCGQGWTPSKRVLLFQFRNDADRLQLHFYIGPGPNVVRETLRQVALGYPRIFQGARKQLGAKHSTIYRLQILAKRDYKDPDLESLMEKMREKWASFLSKDLPAIRDALAKVEWPEVD